MSSKTTLPRPDVGAQYICSLAEVRLELLWSDDLAVRIARMAIWPLVVYGVGDGGVAHLAGKLQQFVYQLSVGRSKTGILTVLGIRDVINAELAELGVDGGDHGTVIARFKLLDKADIACLLEKIRLKEVKYTVQTKIVDLLIVFVMVNDDVVGEFKNIVFLV